MSSVLVTGASRGIGYGLVKAFASAGWDVAVTARRQDDADRVAAELGGSAIGLTCDVTVPGTRRSGGRAGG